MPWPTSPAAVLTLGEIVRRQGHGHACGAKLALIQDGERVTCAERRARVNRRARGGGENISPAALERILREHPDVREVTVAGLPGPPSRITRGDRHAVRWPHHHGV